MNILSFATKALASLLMLISSTMGAEPFVPKPKASSEAIQLATEAVRQQYRSDFAASTTGQQKGALARNLVRVVKERGSFLTDVLGLLVLARQLATEQCDADTAVAAIDELSLRFNVDRLAEKHATLTEIVQKTHFPKDHAALLPKLNIILDEAVNANRYDLARQFAALALSSSRTAKDLPEARRLIAHAKELERVEKQYAAIGDALATLNVNPLDPQANLLVGKFYCLEKFRWGHGAPLLALGSDPFLREMAMDELAENPKALSLGDRWWDWSQRQEKLISEHVQGRAGLWYRMSLPSLAGDTKVRVSKRLGIIAENSHRTLELDGINAWLQTPVKYDGSHPLTIEVYLRPLGGEGTIIGNPEGAGLALEIRKSTATGEPVFAFIMHSDTKYVHLEGTQPVKYGDWTHLACVYDRKQIALFRNGKLEGFNALGGPHKASLLNFFIGCNAQTNGKHSSFTHAEFGNVSISKTARYHKNYLPSHPLLADDDTLLLLLFDDGYGTKVRDTSGHARHATIQNGVWHSQR